MVASIVFRQMITLFLLAAAGFAATKRGIVNTQVSKGISSLITKVCIPAFLVNSLQIPYRMEQALQMGFAALGFFISLLLGLIPAFIISKCRRMDGEEAGILMCCCMASNCLFVGKPIINALFGTEVDYLITSIGVVFNISIIFLGGILISLGRPEGKSFRILLRQLLNPIILAGILGLALYFLNVRLYVPVSNALTQMGNMMTPLSMVLIGHSLAEAYSKEKGDLRVLLMDWRIYVISAVRLLLCPLLTYLVVRLFISDPITLGIVVICSAMPMATMAEILAVQYENKHAVAATKAIFLSTLLCVVSAPLVLSVLSV